MDGLNWASSQVNPSKTKRILQEASEKEGSDAIAERQSNATWLEMLNLKSVCSSGFPAQISQSCANTGGEIDAKRMAFHASAMTEANGLIVQLKVLLLVRSRGPCLADFLPSLR